MNIIPTTIAQQMNPTLKGMEDNNIRPYTKGVSQHDDIIATIVLYNQSNKQNLTAAGNNGLTNYLKSFDTYIDRLIPESMRSSVIGNPETPNGDIPMLSMNTNNDYYGVFNNFSVQSMVESHDQISKVHMNFSANWNVFFFGNTPNIYQFTGVFLDTQDYPYYQEFLVAYEKYLSGRKCVENKMQTKIMLSGQIIDGYILNISVTHNAAIPSLKQFSFTVLVKGTSWVRVNITHVGGLDNGKNTRSEEVLNGLSNLNRLGYINPMDILKTAIEDVVEPKVNGVVGAILQPVLELKNRAIDKVQSVLGDLESKVKGL